MNKGLKIGLWVGAGLGLAFGTWFVIDSYKKSKDQKLQDQKTKEAADKALADAIAKAQVTQPPPVVNTGNTPKPAPVNNNPAITGTVADAVAKYGDSPLIGKKVYTKGPYTAFNTAGQVYTKATSAGQLMGTYAFSKTKVIGGKDIYIKTNDTSAPYIYMGDTLLRF